MKNFDELEKNELQLRYKEKHDANRYEFNGTPGEILKHIVLHVEELDKNNISLINNKGVTISVVKNHIIQFLIFQYTEQRLGKVHVGDYMFEIEYKDNAGGEAGTSLYDIFYVLNRPNNTELSGASKITLVKRTQNGVESLENIFCIYGKKDIKEFLPEWKKSFIGFETPEQEKAENEINAIKDVNKSINEILNEDDGDDSESPEFTVQQYAITEQINAIKELVLKGDTEKAVKYLDVLQFIIEK